jgi:hypothetical protein
VLVNTVGFNGPVSSPIVTVFFHFHRDPSLAGKYVSAGEVEVAEFILELHPRRDAKAMQPDTKS